MSNLIKHYAEVMSGLALGKIILEENPTTEQTFKLIRPQDLAQSSLLTEGELKDLDTITVTEELRIRIKDKHFLKPNDIIISARSTSYHVALIQSMSDNTRIIMNNNLICLRPHPAVQHPEAIMLYLNSRWFREHYIQKYFPKMLSISVKWIQEIPFSLPDKSSCQLIAQAVIANQQLKTDLKALSQQSDNLLEAKLFSLSQPTQDA